jgi:superoxide dismutase, Fe-Mn family
MNKRTFLKTSALLGAGTLIGSNGFAAGKTGIIDAFTSSSEGDEFILPPLGYGYDALEPFIDTLTMQIHHDKHHAAYTKNLNAEVTANKLQGKKIEELLMNVSKYSLPIRNNGGGYFNHSFFWETLAPKGGNPQGALADAINKDFGSFQNFKDELSKKAMSVFGSGWGWLIYADGKLKTISTTNQDSPIMDIAADKGYPLLNIDVWEHAYYLKYHNVRKDYVDAIWNVINWTKVGERYSKAISK